MLYFPADYMVLGQMCYFGIGFSDSDKSCIRVIRAYHFRRDYVEEIYDADRTRCELPKVTIRAYCVRSTRS